ncbi:hypothetical protein HPB48_010736 [Haemaphysalis longicornis]|uniref:DDE Tnp4 domain-containing protein n=1 Tax=Haemaphysalis longicornis TaxID=44386 RepID=A0A9J6F9G9_HAELO|nr:hypothetical protein HPB48_010736 [Haemaphysalis longicornis]
MQQKYLEKCRELSEMKEKVDMLEQEVKLLHDRNVLLEKSTHAKAWGYHKIAGSSENVSYYTGLPNQQVFLWVVGVFAHCAQCVPSQGLSLEDQVLLVLMRLGLDIHLFFLADLFGIGKNSACKLFETVLTLLVAELKMLIVWPDDISFNAWLPEAFRTKFSRVKVIIDSTEIRLEKASGTTAQSATWSPYKNSNTVKVLIGITPNGLISYVSECWGGKISDKQLVLKTDFTSKLDYGDEVLADHGFDVSHELASLGVTLVVPAYTKGKKQLSRAEVNAS